MRAGYVLRDMTTRTSRALAALSISTFLLALLPATAIAAPTAGALSIPVSQGEAPARACYLRAQQLWNATMADASRDRKQLDTSYQTFASCAKMAIDTGKVLRNGRRFPWMPEYFANTVGATYAQLQLATVTANPEHCTHLVQAKDLAEQASETEGEMMPPGDANFETMWEALRQNLKSQTSTCGKAARLNAAHAAAVFRTHDSVSVRRP